MNKELVVERQQINLHIIVKEVHTSSRHHNVAIDKTREHYKRNLYVIEIRKVMRKGKDSCPLVFDCYCSKTCTVTLAVV